MQTENLFIVTQVKNGREPVQSSKQPMLSPRTPSSQFSRPVITYASPHIGEQIFVAEVLSVFQHLKPYSALQLKHPSPAIEFPSSHSSEGVIKLSPHISLQVSLLNQDPPEH